MFIELLYNSNYLPWACICSKGIFLLGLFLGKLISEGLLLEGLLSLCLRFGGLYSGGGGGIIIGILQNSVTVDAQCRSMLLKPN